MQKGENIIIVGLWSWECTPFLPHHMAMEFSKTNRVLWIDHTFFFSDIVRHPGRFQIKMAKMAIKKRLKSLEIRTKNLFIYHPPPLLLTHGYSNINDKINELVIMDEFRKCLTKLSFCNPILWVYQPHIFDVISLRNKVKVKLICYECVDDFTSFANFKMKEKAIKAREKTLLKSADLVITSSSTLFQQKRKYNDHTYYLPPAADSEHYAKALDASTKIPKDIVRIRKPIIGYVGTLGALKINWDLVESVCKHNPFWSVVMVGPTFDPLASRLGNLGNLHFLGNRPVEMLPNYLKAFDVCIIPFNINRFSASAFPTKTFEYLASGRPVVSTYLPSLMPFSPVVKVGKSIGEFIKFIEESINRNNDEQIPRRIALAKEHTWEKRVERAMDLVRKILFSRA